MKNDNYSELKKSFLIIINIHRNSLKEKLNAINFYKNWENNSYPGIGYENLYKLKFSDFKIDDLIKYEGIFDENSFLKKNAKNIFHKFVYKTNDKKNKKEIVVKHISISKKTLQDVELKKNIMQKIYKYIKNPRNQIYFRQKNWKKMIFTNNSKIIMETNNFFESIKNSIEEILSVLLTKIILNIEKYGSIKCFSCFNKSPEDSLFLKKMFFEILEKENMLFMNVSNIRANNSFELKEFSRIPFFEKIYENIISAYEKFIPLKNFNIKSDFQKFSTFIKDEICFKENFKTLFVENNLMDFKEEFFREIFKKFLEKENFEREKFEILFTIFYRLEEYEEINFTKKGFLENLFFFLENKHKSIFFINLENEVNKIHKICGEKNNNFFLEFLDKKINDQKISNLMIICYSDIFKYILGKMNLKEKDNLQKYINILKNIFSIGQKMEDSDIIKRILLNINFWILFLDLLAEINYNSIEIIQSIKDLNIIFIGDKFLQNENLKKYIDEIEKKFLVKENNKSFYKFLNYYFEFNILNFPELINEIEIKMENEEFYKNSKNLINRIIKESNLYNLVTEIIFTIQDERILNNENLIEKIEDVIKLKTIDSILIKSLMDNIFQEMMDYSLETNPNLDFGLISNKFNILKTDLKHFDPEKNDLKNFARRIRLRYFIEIYCLNLKRFYETKYFEKENHLDEEIKLFQDIIKEKKCEKFLRSYTLNRLCNLLDMDLSEFINLISKNYKISWILKGNKVKNENSINNYLVDFREFDEFDEFYRNLEYIFQINPEEVIITDFLNTNFDKKYLFTLYCAIQTIVYSKIKDLKFDWDPLKKIFENIKNKINQNPINLDIYKIIFNFIKKSKDLKILKNNEKKKNFIYSSFQSLYFHSKHNNSPLKNIFFSSQDKSQITQKIKKTYLFGIEDQSLYDYLLDLSKNINNTSTLLFGKFQNQGSRAAKLYQCSELKICNYLYYIPNCGYPMATLNCPNCKKKIGGTSHNLLEREGHKLIRKKNEGTEILKRLTDEQAKWPTGYYFCDLPNNGKDYVCRELNILGFRVLRIFMQIGFWFLFEVMEFRRDDMARVIKVDKPFEFLGRHLEKNLKIISEIVDNKDFDVFIFKIIVDIFHFLKNRNNNFLTYQDRENFEKEFQKEIIQKNSNIVNIITNYKKEINDRKEGNNNNIVTEQIKSNLFRITPQIDSKICDKILLKLKNSNKNISLLQFYNKKKKEVEKLICLKNIMDLSNHINTKYSYILQRSETMENSIEYYLKKDKKLQDLYDQFETNWNKYMKYELQWECKLMEIKEFNKEEPFINIILDISEHTGGRYLYLGIKELAKLQNESLTELKEILRSKNKFYLLSCNDLEKDIQNFREENLIFLNYDLQKLIKTNCVNRFEDNRAGEYFVDLERIDNMIIEEFNNKCFLNSKYIKKFKYFSSNLSQENGEETFTILKKKIDFLNLDKDEMLNLNKLVDKNSDKIYIKDIFSSIKYIFDQIINYDDIPKNKSIQYILQNFNLESSCPEILKKEKTIVHMELEKIKSIYEFFEKEYFEKILLHNLNPFFKKNTDPENNKKIEKILKNEKIGKQFPNLKDIKLTLIKLISRQYEDIEESTYDYPLYTYLESREDIWSHSKMDYKKIEKINIEDIFTKDILFSNVINVYNLIDKKKFENFDCDLENDNLEIINNDNDFEEVITEGEYRSSRRTKKRKFTKNIEI